jgi:hypothetical protein
LCFAGVGVEVSGGPRHTERHDIRRGASFPGCHPPRLAAEGFGARLTKINNWLDENCGADGWAMTPFGTCGVLNDAVAIYFLDATLASAFVARWCAGFVVETAGGVFRVERISRQRGSGLGCTGHHEDIALGWRRLNERRERCSGQSS